MTDIEKIKKEIVQRLQPLDVEKVILFGSYARGEQTEDSDIDLYVVTKDNFIPKNWREKNSVYLSVARAMRGLRDKAPLDLIVHTHKMYEKFIELNSSFCRDIFQGGVNINARKNRIGMAKSGK